MRNFILRRLLQTLPMLLLASFIIFLLFAKTPGDFIDGNITLTAARAAELKAIYGLDQPLLTRYLHWLGQLLRGDLGFSLQYQIPVSQLLNQYIWNSFLLASVALVFYWGIGLAVGVVSALRPGSWFDHLVSVAVFAAMSFPTFFLCLLLIKWFAVDLHWLPVGGMTNTGSDESGWQYVLQVAAHLALPVLALVMLQAGSLTRYVRASMLDVVKMDFIRTARAKGLQERTVILKHALRNALLPIITLLGFELPGLFSGAIITEKVFNWPGAGHIHIDSLAARDYPVLMGFYPVSGGADDRRESARRRAVRLGRSAYSGEVMMILSYLASRRRQRQAAIPALAHITPSPWRQGWRQLRRNRLAMFCLILLAVMAVWCVLGPVWSPWSDDATDALSINQPPGAEHWLGTDFLGRDVYTRLLLAGRISLIIGLLTMVMSVCLGYLLGALSGYVGGLTDKLIMRVADLVMTIPGLPLLIVAGAMLSELDFSPDSRIYMVVVMLSLLEWPRLARLVRGQCLSLRERDFMLATQVLGLSARRRLFGHLLPNTIPILVVMATMAVANAILSESALSYLGLGVVPPTPSWGNMMDAANSLIDFQRRPWLWMPPGIAIFITVIAINVLGDGLRDAMDPNMKPRLK